MNTQTHTEQITTPEFTGKAAEFLKNYYDNLDPVPNTVQEKLAALQANLGYFEFSAYGGGETEEMKLRAAERVYLLKNRIPVQ